MTTLEQTPDIEFWEAMIGYQNNEAMIGHLNNDRSKEAMAMIGPPAAHQQAKIAKDLLAHCFRMAAEGGWKYDGDSTADIEEIVDLIIRAAVEVARAETREMLEQLESRINELEGRANE